MSKCINRNHPDFKKLQEETKLPSIVLEMRISKWQENNQSDVFPKAEDIVVSNEVNQGLKAVQILTSDKAKQIFEKGKKANWDLNKILIELQVPKEQRELINSLGKTELDDIITTLLADYSYTIEINVAQQHGAKYHVDGFQEVTSVNGRFFTIESDGDFGREITKEEYEKINNKSGNSDYYSNLTVPGGTNYTENEIKTPDITPSIKGHAQFATDKGIGWFRSDEQTENGELIEFDDDKNQRTISQSRGGTPTKTRRILEVQSDLFQKGRDKEDLTVKGLEKDLEREVAIQNSRPEADRDFDYANMIENELERFTDNKSLESKNQFLQLLNKNSNWVTFFIKSIIQDSVKKGYEKVLFPSGNTASKVEGHTTLEEFKREKENRLEQLKEELQTNKQKQSINSFEDIKQTDFSIKNDRGERIDYIKRDNIWVKQKLTNEGEFKQAKPTNEDVLNAYKESLKFLKSNDNIVNEINQLKQELERIEKEGFGALRPIYNFYENTVTNILNKVYGKENVKQITDEYGNTWNEVTIDTSRDTGTIYFQKNVPTFTETDAINELTSLNVVHKAYGEYFVTQGTIMEDATKVNKVTEKINLGRINSLNEKFNQYTGGIPVYDVKKTRKGNAHVVHVNPLALEAMNNYVRRAKHQITPSDIFAGKAPNTQLNESLTSFLSSLGVSVEGVEQIKTRSGGDAIAVADLVNRVIRVVQGKAKEDTLPEEAGHMILAMLGTKSPLYQRMLTLASKSQLLETVKGQYANEYTTEAQFVFETAGKLLGGAFVNQFGNEKPSLIDNIKATLKLILTRLKSLFRPNSTQVIESLIEQEYGKFASSVLNDTVEQSEFLNVGLEEDIIDEAYQVDPFMDILKRAQNSLKLQIKKFERLKQKEGYQEKLKDTLQDLLDNENIEGFTKFVEQAKSDINLAYARYTKMIKTNKPMDLKELRNIRNHVSAYHTLDEFIATRSDDIRFEKVKAKLMNTIEHEDGTITKSTMAQKAEIEQIFLEYAKDHIATFLYSYGKANPSLTEDIIKNQLNYASRDINAAVSWLDSIGDSRDSVLALASKAIRSSKENARLRSIKAKQDLLQIITDYEKKTGEKGLKAFEGLLEVDSEGNVTGNWVSKLDSQFWKDREVEKERLNKLYKNEDKVAVELKKWTKNNYKKDKYKAQWNKLKANKDKYELYLNLKAMQDEAEQFLPDTFNMREKIPQVRKSTLERVLTGDKRKAGKILKEELEDRFTIQPDETEYGVTDIAGKPINTLPIYYANRIAGDELNTDLVSSIYKFYVMAANYHEMAQIQDELETIQDLLGKREVAKVRFGKEQTSTVTGEVITTPGIESNSYKMYEQYLASQLYGQTKAESVSIELFGKHIPLDKIGDFLNKYTAFNGLALNLFSGVSNITVGKIARIGEAIAGQYYNEKDLAAADVTYMKNLVDYLGNDVGSRTIKSKLGLWIEYFDVLQNFTEDVSELKAFQSNRFSRMFRLNSLFFFNSGGEHYMQTTTALAAGRNWKLSTGKVVNMWEATKVENGKLVFTDPDITVEESKRFGETIKGINQSLDGIYNSVDKSNAQRFVVGRLALMFRKFIVPGVQKRLKGVLNDEAMFNYRTGTYEQGMYVTFGRFIAKVAKDLGKLQFNLIAHWNDPNFTDWQKANVKRTLTELMFMLGLMILIKGLEDWEDDEKVYQFMAYEANRTYTELRFFSSPNEALKILKSPAAAVTSVQSVSGLIGMAMQPWNWTDRYERGRSAGDLKIGVKFTDVIPIVNKVSDWEDVGKQIDYLK